MIVRTLVVTKDPDVIRELQPVLGEMGMAMNLSLSRLPAENMLQSSVFGAAIVDCEPDADGLAMLRSVRAASTESQRILAVGVVDKLEAATDAFANGANFVLTKPLSVEDMRRVLNMAKGLAAGTVRKCLRIAVEHASHVRLDALEEPAFIVNLGEGGVALQAFDTLQVGQLAEFSFFLPGSEDCIEGRGQVVWADSTGRAGVEFTEMSAEAREQLNAWVLARAHQKRVPSAVYDEKQQRAVDAMGDTIQVGDRWAWMLARGMDAAIVFAAMMVFWVVATTIGDVPWLSRMSMLFAGGLLTMLGAAYGYLFHLGKVPTPGVRMVRFMASSMVQRPQESAPE